jgi:putative intracellular protease/amidase
MNETIALVVARDGFRAEEYFDVVSTLTGAGINVVTVSDVPGQAKAHDGRTVRVDITVEEVDPHEYDGIFLIGGLGAMQWLNTQSVYDMMRAAVDANILWGAICISPRILYHADLLEGKKITGWNGDGLLKTVCVDADVVGGSVAVDGHLITAEGPASAKEFGAAMVKMFRK